MEKGVAREVLDLLSICSSKLEDAAQIIRRQSISDEFAYHRTEYAKVMGYLLLNLMWPIYDQHPDLVPEALKKSFSDWRNDHGESAASFPFGRRRLD